jgi:3-phenylpropionate/trans-cinnamate dioxygenase ferredoxin reductase component
VNAVKSVVIIGAGQAGAVAARTLRRRGFDGRVHLVGAESSLPYQRPPLSKEYLAEADDDGLFLLDPQRCEALRVEVHLDTAAERIDPRSGRVELSGGGGLDADAVLLATGGSSRRLPGVAGERVHYLRTIRDCDRLREAIVPGSHLVVVGAGFIGSEVAAAARARAAEVTVIETCTVPLERVLGRQLGAVCATLHRNNGVTLRLGELVESIVETTDGVRVTTSGGVVDGDHVLIGIGMVPNVEVAERSGIAVGDGVLVDEYCRTSMANVYAAGDVANHWHPLFEQRLRVEHFDNASRQAGAAATTMAGRPTVYADPHWFWSDQYDANLQYAGHAHSSDDLVIRGSLDERDFCAFFLRDGLIRGAFGIDRGEEVLAAKELIAGRARVRPELLADDDTDLMELAMLEQQP